MERSRSSKLVVGIVLLVVGAGLLIWALTGKKADAPASSTDTSQSTNAEDSADTSSEAASNTEASTATITFTNDGFTPETLTVKTGTVVTVKNESSDPVQFSSDNHPTHREDPEINMKTLAPGESGTFTAKTVGKHGFHDHMDDSKTGVLVVTE
jgi:plastocyanin